MENVENGLRNGRLKPRKLWTPTATLPSVLLHFLRWDIAGFWLWGSLIKSPWEDFGCAEHVGGFCVRGYLQSLSQNLPPNLGSWLIAPNNILAVEWFQFGIESILAVLLFLGLFTRGTAVLASLWSAVISVTLVVQPGYVLPDTLLFLIANVALVFFRGGNELTIDRFLGPWLRRRTSRIARALARWTY